MGMDLKQKIMESLRSTWNSLHDFARAHRSETVAASDSTDNSQGLENEVDQQVNSVMAQMVQQQDVDKSDTICKLSPSVWACGGVHGPLLRIFTREFKLGHRTGSQNQKQGWVAN